MIQMAQQFPPHGAMGPGHPGMQHAHPMGGMQHPGAAHMGGQPGPGMMPGMHAGVSGPQVSQGPMVTGMPTGPGTPASGGQMQNAHAMAHLGPGQQPMFQPHNPQMNLGQMAPNFQQQQHMMHQARQRQLHQMMQQQQQQQHQHGMPVNMPGGMQYSQAQLNQMKAGMGMPNMQQMQMQQAAASQQAQNFQQQRLLQAHQQAQQQAAMQAQAQQQRAVAQQMQMSRSQEPATQPPQPHPTPAPQNAVQAQSAPAPQQQPQPPQTKQPQVQPNNPQQQQSNQPRPQQGEPIVPQEETEINQQDSGEEMVMNPIPKAPDFNGRMILHLLLFQDQLKNVDRPQELGAWEDFVHKHFSPMGSVRQQVFNSKLRTSKQFQVIFASLGRFYHAHFVCGIQKIEMTSSDCMETDLGNGCHHVCSHHSTFTYVFQNGIRVTTMGTLGVNFDAMNKIEHLSINTSGWSEYIPRQLLQIPESPDQKQDAKIKQNLKRSNTKGGPSNSPPSVPGTVVTEFGMPAYIIQYLELAETMAIMDPLFAYFQDHPGITPRDALNQIVLENSRKYNQFSANMNGGMMPQRNPGINAPNHFASPAMGHLGLPQGQGSPHIGGPVHTPSPAQNHIGGVNMMHQMSQQGSNLSGSQGPSTNTSPNVSHKRRRASAIKLEDGNPSEDVNGAGPTRVKSGPQIGVKRQKGTK